MSSRMPPAVSASGNKRQATFRIINKVVASIKFYQQGRRLDRFVLHRHACPTDATRADCV